MHELNVCLLLRIVAVDVRALQCHVVVFNLVGSKFEKHLALVDILFLFLLLYSGLQSGLSKLFFLFLLGQPPIVRRVTRSLMALSLNDLLGKDTVLGVLPHEGLDFEPRSFLLQGLLIRYRNLRLVLLVTRGHTSRAFFVH